MDFDITTIKNLPTIQQTVQQFGLHPEKRLGQNFLYDMNITHKIVRIAGDVTCGTVIEIGPGPGGLTRAILLGGACDVVAIDMDKRAVTALWPLVQASQKRLQVLQGDASTHKIWHMGNSPRQIIANLPYNVGTHLLLSWIQHAHSFSKMTLMFQQEVAQRITAQQGDKHYGRLAVLCNWACHTHLAMRLPPSVFTPPPKVDSAVVTLTPRKHPLYDCHIADLQAVTKSAFGQRRKMLRQSLKTLGTDTAELLRKSKIPPTARAEQLTIKQFCTLAQVYGQK